MNGKEGGVNVTNCVECPAGLYCDEQGTVTAEKKCLAGYYCPPGVLIKLFLFFSYFLPNNCNLDVYTALHVDLVLQTIGI